MFFSKVGLELMKGKRNNLLIMSLKKQQSHSNKIIIPEICRKEGRISFILNSDPIIG